MVNRMTVIFVLFQLLTLIYSNNENWTKILRFTVLFYLPFFLCFFFRPPFSACFRITCIFREELKRINLVEQKKNTKLWYEKSLIILMFCLCIWLMKGENKNCSVNDNRSATSSKINWCWKCVCMVCVYEMRCHWCRHFCCCYFAGWLTGWFSWLVGRLDGWMVTTP